MKIVYDKKYPPNTTDYTPIIRAVQASNPDIVIVCSYPLGSVGIVQAVRELNYKPKIIGGAMVGLQATVFKQKLGPKLNGIINYETWVPSDKMMKPAVEFFKKYQAKAGAEGVDPLGYYLGGWGYAYANLLGEAIAGSKSIDDNKIADWLRKNTHKTIMGDWSYGPGGEWTKSSMMQVQYHDIKEGAGLETWKGMSYQTVLTPADLKTGDVVYPYEKAAQ
jgi:branched-chain amino acid transport system substrate-binding protein